MNLRLSDVAYLTSETSTATDPYFSSVSLLLHMDGSNGSTTFTDTSPTPKTVTASGNAKISTAQSKFGSASGLFDGNGDGLSVGGSAAFTFPADFTIECWIYIVGAPSVIGSADAGSTHGTIISTTAGSNQGWSFLVLGNPGTVPNLLYFEKAGGGYAGLSGGSVPASQWNHVAVSRASTTTRLFINGTQAASGTISGTVDSSNVAPFIGRTPWSSYFRYLNGYMDDLRITKGVARYTANFTPPTAAFPDAGETSYYGDWTTQTYGFEADIYPPWWAS